MNSILEVIFTFSDREEVGGVAPHLSSFVEY
jgi:hypothetical protein